MTAPAVNQNRAQDLMRLGWAIAELRGRLYFGAADPGRIADPATVRADHSLPLSGERSPKEQLIETKEVVQALAKRANLELDGGRMKDSRGHTATTPCTAAARAIELADQVPDKRSATSWGDTWDSFTEALYQWDAAIQDHLASASFGESSAYQLGRGLAECSWALDPNWPPNEVMGWEHVLGSERCVALTRLLERLTPALPTATASAIKGSLAAWQRVARDPAWRSGTNPEAPVFLRHQVNAWRDMLIVGADPQTFERAPRPLQEVANIIPIIKGLWVQIVAALLSAGILAAGAWAITRYGNSQPWGALISALGIVGVTGSGLLASAKKKATGLVERVQAAIAADERAKAATIIPDRPQKATVKSPGRLSTPGSFAEPITLSKLGETPELSGAHT